MKFKKKYLLLIPLILLIAATVNFLKDHFSPFRFSGTVEATQIIISSRISGNIQTISIKEGDLVKVDSELLKVDCKDIEVMFDRLADDYQRARKLSNSGATSKESMDKASSLFKEAEIKKSWCTIKSPIDGIVTNKFREVGEYVTPGTKLFSVLDQDDYWAFFYIPQNLINRFKVGELINTILPETKEVFEGRIIKINETAEFTPKNVQTYDERARLVYGIKIKIPNNQRRLKPGMTLEIEIEK